jgi:hypothetical protein
MGYTGTFIPNRRRVIRQAPDCLVYLQGELTLPSGASPFRRVEIQPLITSVTTSMSVAAPPGTADISMQIPTHLNDDLRRGGRLILTPMMEVRIYMKGAYLLNGAPQYYPVFWGVVREVSESYSGGEHSVSLSCEDMTYWWKVQFINTNPSALALESGQARNFTAEGNVFTGLNPFQVLYTLSRQVHGDSVLSSLFLQDFQVFGEAKEDERLELMAYWAKRWNRIGTALRMFGPDGRLIVGDRLAAVLKRNNVSYAPSGKRGSAAAREGAKFVPPTFDFTQGTVDLTTITPFSLAPERIGNSLDPYTSELQTKLQIAQQVAECIGYEFYMDVTGELIFKPPFYNLDVRDNFPVSWIQPIDIISESFSESPPEATYISGSGQFVQNWEIGMSAEVVPRATYVDYQLVQRYGWIPTELQVSYIGAQESGGGTTQGGPQALFAHLVDQLDKINARTCSGSVTIPLRPELRGGYPMYHETRDAYYYVDGISHSFAFGGQCTTSLNFLAERARFYGAFEGWDAQAGREPAPGSTADPGVVVRNMFSRPQDSRTGKPVGDRNVILAPVEGARKAPVTPRKTDASDAAKAGSRAEELKSRIVDMSSQFSPVINGAAYVYQVDPARDNPVGASVTPYKRGVGAGQLGVITQLTAFKYQGNNAFVFPVSDERGYKVFGGYEYGRSVQVQNSELKVQVDPNDLQAQAAFALTFLSPESSDDQPSLLRAPDPLLFNSSPKVTKGYEGQISPTNYGRLLSEVGPDNLGLGQDLIADAKQFVAGLDLRYKQQNLPSGSPSRNAAASSPALTPAGRGAISSSSDAYLRSTDGLEQDARGWVAYGPKAPKGAAFTYNSNVGRWRDTIRRVRAEEGLTEAEVPDSLVLAIIQLESGGNPSSVGRKTKSGKDSQFNGLMHMGTALGESVGLEGGTTALRGDGELAIRSFMKAQKVLRGSTKGDPVAIVLAWSKGGAPARQYNARRAEGLSPEEALAHPSVAKFNPQEYVDRARAARQVWIGRGIDSDGGGPPPSLNEEAVAAAPVEEPDEANDPTQPPADGADVGDEDGPVFSLEDFERNEQAQAVGLFRDALQGNVSDGTINALPPGLIPPRDPSLVSVLNEYLLGIYNRGFQEAQERERVLRGQDLLAGAVQARSEERAASLSGLTAAAAGAAGGSSSSGDSNPATAVNGGLVGGLNGGSLGSPDPEAV